MAAGKSKGDAVKPELTKADKCDYILKAMTYDGKSLRQACRDLNIAPSNFIYWCDEDQKLAEHYARAREALLEHWAEDILLISDTPVGSLVSGGADSGAVAKQRLQVDSRKWLLSKLAPKKYGEKIETTHAGSVEVKSVERVIIDPKK